MPVPQLTPEKLSQIAARIAQYIQDQRRHYLTRSLPLAPAQRSQMSGFFSSELLDAARMVILRNERVANPEFYGELVSMGFTNLPDFSHLEAITYETVIVSHEGFTPRRLFHELVHIAQYRQLGVQRFAELYLRGFVLHGGYYNVPLEMQAYNLAARFAASPHEAFTVADEVTSWISDNKF